MKLCPHCSASLEEDTVKCKRCGRWTVPVRDTATPKRGKGSNWRRLAVLGVLAIAAAAVWAMPDGPLGTREILNLRPSRQVAINKMRKDLNGLVNLQDRYFGLNGGYSASPSALRFEASEGVSVSLIATPTGWSASARHEDHPPTIGCAVFGGSASPPQAPVVPSEAGVSACTEGTP
ncbi:MAG: hypothetical protein HKO65_06760 [Gemmatimonadetes bacterium]|nr:hypothetical protein [Gemmatimonadota bacterium]